MNRKIGQKKWISEKNLDQKIGIKYINLENLRKKLELTESSRSENWPKKFYLENG